MENGIILKGIGGFYYVETSDGIVYECKARGIFRKNKIKPFVGDRVLINTSSDGFSYIEDVLERRNVLIRPPISNIDQILLVVSTCDPAPNTIVMDKIIAVAVNKEIEPVIIVTKIDLLSSDSIRSIYDKTNIKCIEFSSKNPVNVDKIKEVLSGRVSAFTGNTGVGKSTLMNFIDKDLLLETGETSKKLGRGRHTTRFVELFKLGKNTYVADTPGFSTVDIDRYETIDKSEIQFCFEEFFPYINNCEFSSCSHTSERGCELIKAVDMGIISSSRYSSYVYMYNEVKNIKSWEKKK